MLFENSARERFPPNRPHSWRRLWSSLAIAAMVCALPLPASHAETSQVTDDAVHDARSQLKDIERRAAKDPRNASLQRALYTAHLRLGDELKAGGDLGTALVQFQEALALVEGLAAQDPGNTPLQRDLSRIYRKIGDVFAGQGDKELAMHNYLQSHAITQRLSQADPADARAKADLDASRERIRAAMLNLEDDDREQKVGAAPPPASAPKPAAPRPDAPPPGDIIPGGGNANVLPSKPVPSRPPPKAAAAPPPPAAAPGGPGGASQLPMFPWPPPQASATYVLPASLITRFRTIGDFTGALLSVLQSNGYVERSFYGIPKGGVALVTRLERINDDGTPVADAARWPASASGQHGARDSLYELLRGLFYADPGRYRVIVFVMRTLHFTQSPDPVTPSQARAWLKSGANVLPPDVAAQPMSGVHCTALIYEFASDGSGVQVVESELTGLSHLQQAGVLSSPKKEP